MGFDLGAGLAGMGASIAQTAGSAALEMQKAGLEEDKVRLADELATTRESAGRQEQEVLAEKLATKTSGLEVSAHLTNSENDARIALQNVVPLAKARQDAINAVASDPTALDNLSKFALASDPTAKAKIAASMAEAALSQFNLKVAKAKDDAQQAYAAAVQSRDATRINTARSTLDALEHTPGQEAQAATAAEAVARLVDTTVTGLQGKLDSFLKSPTSQTIEGKASAKAQQDYVDSLKAQQQSLVESAVRAARSMPGAPASGGGTPGAPSVLSLAYGTATAPGDSGTGNSGADTGATGMNSWTSTPLLQLKKP